MHTVSDNRNLPVARGSATTSDVQRDGLEVVECVEGERTSLPASRQQTAKSPERLHVQFFLHYVQIPISGGPPGKCLCKKGYFDD